MVMTNFGQGRNHHGKNKLLCVDVSCAYFYAPSRRPVYVKLPEEDDEPGMCGRLNVSMYGTQDAAANWEYKYATSDGEWLCASKVVAMRFLESKHGREVCCAR